MAEDARQEISFDLGGKTYTVRPTWQALSAIETATGESCYALGVKMFNIRDVGIGEMAVILRALATSDERNGKDVPTISEIGEILFQDGYRQYLVVGDPPDQDAAAIPKLLIAVLKGHKLHMREAALQKTEKKPDPLKGD